MHVVAFAPSRKSELEQAGGVLAEGFPMTSCYVESFPAQIVVPLVLAVYTNAGTDFDPRRYIVAKSPQGERVGLLEFAWHWPDTPGIPVKFRVFVHHLPMWVDAAGVYEIGLADSPESAQLDSAFPFPVLDSDPALSISS